MAGVPRLNPNCDGEVVVQIFCRLSVIISTGVHDADTARDQ